MSVALETACDAKECRSHFFVTGDISEGEEIIYDYGVFLVISG